ncbi:hypothetical protein MM236_14530 [Belliella sp. DSM 107340]|uniref:TM2 domain-containing protein n=1 Tax=Belliella calami TaxID=2923436 RepID=A0ABS9USH9_9BACT|nr:hypothetical protein [Belliella calami]MCH7399218.1 hypothetical protein [Belliella calami]
MESTFKKCPYCAEEIYSEAIKCKHCGEILDNQVRAARQQNTQFIMPQNYGRRWSPGIAALLSFIIPGAGQMYKGDVGTGIAWFLFVVLGYFLFIVPGLILHLICIISAASGDPFKI